MANVLKYLQSKLKKLKLELAYKTSKGQNTIFLQKEIKNTEAAIKQLLK